jgi:hydrogenase-4 component B
VNTDAILLISAAGFPGALTALVLLPAAREILFRMLPIAPLPALAAALLVPDGTGQPFPSTLLGAGIVLDGIGRVFLGIAALVWVLAGLFATSTISGDRCRRFAGFWLASLTGNLLLFVAADVVSFYLAFSLLSLSVFGLIIHNDTAQARRAGRVYIVLAIFGETCLLVALLIGAHEANSVLIGEVRHAIVVSPHRDLALAMLVTGLGLKAGLLPLHVWLPLAHPAAPVAASAVLSGAIVKAGIFGLCRFLPLTAELSDWSSGLITLGLATTYFGILAGVCQRRPKTVLAYSTLSQMGLVVAVLGTGLGSQDPLAALAAVTLYCAFHSLAKGAMFLSVGVYRTSAERPRGPIMLIVALIALAMAGFPFTGGALAKLVIKNPIGDGPAGLLVTLSAVGTTLLMLRFLQLLRRTPLSEGNASPQLLLPFLLCVAAAFSLPWILLPNLTDLTANHAFDPANLWSGLWPILIGGALMFGLLAVPNRPKLNVPEGDLIIPLERVLRQVKRVMQWSARTPSLPMENFNRLKGLPQMFARSEQKFAQLSLAGMRLLVIGSTVAGLAAA